MALYRKCPHLGCQVPQLCNESQWFECLCHGSKYTVLGEKRDGPAPRGMDRFNVIVEDGTYIVDTSEVVSGPPPGTIGFDERGPTDMPHCTG
jgi:cytochrome b6-f complex iron-sulfur subunit